MLTGYSNPMLCQCDTFPWSGAFWRSCLESVAHKEMQRKEGPWHPLEIPELQLCKSPQGWAQRQSGGEGEGSVWDFLMPSDLISGSAPIISQPWSSDLIILSIYHLSHLLGHVGPDHGNQRQGGRKVEGEGKKATEKLGFPWNSVLAWHRSPYFFFFRVGVGC